MDKDEDVAPPPPPPSPPAELDPPAPAPLAHPPPAPPGAGRTRSGAGASRPALRAEEGWGAPSASAPPLELGPPAPAAGPPPSWSLSWGSGRGSFLGGRGRGSAPSPCAYQLLLSQTTVSYRLLLVSPYQLLLVLTMQGSPGGAAASSLPHASICTLHPAPCTLHPAPCTLHPAP